MLALVEHEGVVRSTEDVTVDFEGRTITIVADEEDLIVGLVVIIDENKRVRARFPQRGGVVRLSAVHGDSLAIQFDALAWGLTTAVWREPNEINVN